ncbi:protein inturned-like [Gigantopelta aegis]|uniref:protein inturned-like n=1 Tax=Gigantopelta aegis TaxID=1735272 RepID=UPI001B88CA09|nr:protein inturned-like [Gigantopelta aegis]
MAYFPKIGPFYDPDNEQEIYGDSHGRIQMRTFPPAKNEGALCQSFLTEDKLGRNWTTYVNREEGGVYFVSVDNGKQGDTSANVSAEHQNGHEQHERYDASQSVSPRRPSMDSGLGYSPSCDYEPPERNNRYTGSGKKEVPMPRIEEVTDFRRGDSYDKQYHCDQTYSQVLSRKKDRTAREEEVTDFRSSDVLDSRSDYATDDYHSPPFYRTINGNSEHYENGSHAYSRDPQRHSSNCSGNSYHIATKTNQRYETTFEETSYDQTTQQTFDDCVTRNTPMDKSTHSCSVSDTRSTVSQSIVKDSHGVQRCKDVFLLPNFKHVCRTADSGVVLCEKLFGIILFHYNHKTGSGRTGEHNMTNVLRERKVIVQGVTPRSPAEKCGHVHRGDMLISLNDFEVNWLNIDKIFQTLTKREQVKLTFQLPVIVGPKPPLPSSPARPPPPQRDFYKLVTGSDILRGQADLDDITYSLMYLTLSESSDEVKASRDDIVYMYPLYDTKLVDIRGLFLTLNSFLVEVSNSRPKSSLLEIGDKKINIAYWCEDTDVLIVGLPQDRVPLSCLDELLEQIVRLLQIMFGGLSKAFKRCDRNELDQLFSLTFHQVLAPRASHCDLEDCQSHSIFLDTFTGVATLQLSEENKLICDEILSEYEAADFDEFMEEEALEERRSFSVLGCSLFYKEHQLCTHLCAEDSTDVSLFVKHHGLLSMMSQKSVADVVVWQELWPTRCCHRPNPGVLGYQQPSGRWFLLLVGMKHFLLGTLLEVGGCTKPPEEVTGPDVMLVDQAKATLLQLEADIDIADICETRLSCDSGSVPLVRAESYITKKSKRESPHSPLKSPDSPNFASTPLKSAKDAVVRTHSSFGSDKKPGILDDADSDKSGNITVTDNSPVMLRKGSKLSYGSNDSMGSGSSTGAPKTKSSRRSLLNDMANIGRGVSSLQIEEFETCNSDRQLTRGRENCLFHYVKLYDVDGLFVMPSHQQMAYGAIQSQLLDNFYRCSILIRKTFENSNKSKDASSRPDRFGVCTSFDGVQEHGVLFKHCPPSSADSKKSPPSLSYWVVGRKFTDGSELYVCFHESSSQSVVEMAFNLNFGTEL